MADRRVSVGAVVAFLSAEWISALHEVASGDAALADHTANIGLVIEQRVTMGGDGAPVLFHLSFDHGEVTVAAGPATNATVTFTQTEATARAIAMGTASAQRAFMTGELRVGGDLRALVDTQEALAALADVFASVRDRTDFGPEI